MLHKSAECELRHAVAPSPVAFAARRLIISRHQSFSLVNGSASEPRHNSIPKPCAVGEDRVLHAIFCA